MLLHLRHLLWGALSVCALAGPSNAQLNTTVGPNPVPQGGEVRVSFSNDNPGKWGVTTQLWRVRDANGTIIKAPTGPQASILMGPSGVYTFSWDLTDNAGQPVAPGSYTLDVKSDFGAPEQSYPLDVVAEGAGLVLQGTATTQPLFGGGPARSFYLTSPSDAGMPYFVLASTDLVGTLPTCAGTFPMGLSPLLTKSLTPNYVIQSSFGFLGPDGATTAPNLPIPNSPAFVGMQFGAAAVVLDPVAPCLIRRISNAHAMTVL